MIPYTMRVKHDPPRTWGDCYRTSIASILEIEPELVPHPGRNGLEGWGRLIPELAAWLAARNVYQVAFRDTPAAIEEYAAGYGYHLLGGNSPRGGHWCVGLGGRLIHNPSPRDDGLAPNADGTYDLELLVLGAPPARRRAF
jgi:hypothetical protein